MIQWFSELVEKFTWLNNNIKFLLAFLIALISYFLMKNVILKILRKLIHSTKTEIDDVLFNWRVLRRVSYLAPLLILRLFTYLLPNLQSLLNGLIDSLVILTFVTTLSAIFNSLSDHYEKTDKYKERPIKGYIQVVIIFIYIFGIILIIGSLLGESPWTILTGLGALTAVLVLVFRDTILSFVASIQISSYDLVKVGDWIETQKFGADGDVIDISLNVIKVQNFDKTISVIPTYKLLEESFKNWRGMKMSGARRIKRSVFIDQSSIKFCTEEMLDKFEKYQLIKNYIKEKREEINKFNQEMNFDNSVLVNRRRLTNIGTFRAYLIEYLRQRKDLRKDLTFMVRQLPPGSEGLPIEIYIFTSTTDWLEYENVQSDIFDHILAVIPQFELSIFQQPTGQDFKGIQKAV